MFSAGHHPPPDGHGPQSLQCFGRCSAVGSGRHDQGEAGRRRPGRGPPTCNQGEWTSSSNHSQLPDDDVLGLYPPQSIVGFLVDQSSCPCSAVHNQLLFRCNATSLCRKKRAMGCSENPLGPWTPFSSTRTATLLYSSSFTFSSCWRLQDGGRSLDDVDGGWWRCERITRTWAGHCKVSGSADAARVRKGSTRECIQ